MNKIRKVKFKNHLILKDLELDFCDKNGKAVDTVIIAGENGTGKSTVINALYELITGGSKTEAELVVEDDNEVYTINYYYNYSYDSIWVKDSKGINTIPSPPNFLNMYGFYGIFSDVDINFHGKDVSTVTSMELDIFKASRKSGSKLPDEIKQLLIDIQALDDAALARAARENPNKPINQLIVTERMERFTNAFSKIFEELKYSRIDNKKGKKMIYFTKNGMEIPIDDLSSGEKQVIYRGCFLLKDINAINGAFVFIDEPEISLHPNWQMKIMDYYKGIFTDKSGVQTSQIFAVTHSPFVIHNDRRRDDKIIILSRDDNGEIIVKDKPEYFKCSSIEAVQDAFQIDVPITEKQVVYLEGRTDEMYFNKALEVYNYDVDFVFKWIGYIDKNGQEVNTGKDALNKAVHFLISRNSATKSICLYDCDANKSLTEAENVITCSIPKFENGAKISIGIENALVLDEIDIEAYREYREETDGYGMIKPIPNFKKMELCKDICSLDTEKLKRIFINLKTVIDWLIMMFENGNIGNGL